MFEEICLACGRHLTLDGSPYCSEECQLQDTVSTSSASSSSYSSPRLHAFAGPELRRSQQSQQHHRHQHHSRNAESVSSSSASSATWSNSDEEDSAGLTSDTSAPDDVPVKSTSLASNPLMHYVRRPSGTNNRSLVPQLHNNSDADMFSDVGYSEEDDTHDSDRKLSRTAPQAMPIRKVRRMDDSHNKTISKRSSRGNKGSLPAYFSLLQMGSPSRPTTSVSHTSSSFHPPSATTITREAAVMSKASPPTPKISYSRLGRMHCPASDSSPSVSPRDRARERSSSVLPPRLRLSSKSSNLSNHTATRAPSSEKCTLESSQILMSRGRTTARRDSVTASPPSALPVHPPSQSVEPRRTAVTTIKRDSKTASPRGRARLNSGETVTAEAPGLGNGRSGILDRARRTSSRRAPITP